MVYFIVFEGWSDSFQTYIISDDEYLEASVPRPRKSSDKECRERKMVSRLGMSQDPRIKTISCPKTGVYRQGLSVENFLSGPTCLNTQNVMSSRAGPILEVQFVFYYETHV